MVTFNLSTGQFENMPPGITVLDLTIQQLIYNDGYIVHLVGIGFWGKWRASSSKSTTLILNTFSQNKAFSRVDPMADSSLFIRACEAVMPFTLDIDIPEDQRLYVSIWHVSLRYLLSISEYGKHLKNLYEYFTLFDRNLFKKTKDEARELKGLSKSNRELICGTLTIWGNMCEAIEFLREPVIEIYGKLKSIS